MLDAAKSWLREALDGDGRVRGGRVVGGAVGALILLSAAALMVETLPTLDEAWRRRLAVFDVVVTVAFMVEYLARLWAAGVRPGSWRARARWAMTPAALLDLAASAPPALALAFGVNLGPVRLLRLFRVVRVRRFARAMATLRAVVWAKRGELGVVASLVAVMLVIFAVLIHWAESEAQPERFASAFDGLWWAVITMTTIGYGDLYPMTSFGRAIGFCAALLGIGIITLPAGIIAGGLLEQLKHREEHVSAARCPHCGGELAHHHQP